MMRGSAGGCVGGLTVTVITRDVTASGGLGTGSEVSSCQWVPRPSQEPRRCFGWGGGGYRRSSPRTGLELSGAQNFG